MNRVDGTRKATQHRISSVDDEMNVCTWNYVCSCYRDKQNARIYSWNSKNKRLPTRSFREISFGLFFRKNVIANGKKKKKRNIHLPVYRNVLNNEFSDLDGNIV